MTKLMTCVEVAKRGSVFSTAGGDAVKCKSRFSKGKSSGAFGSY
jgi:hypothetical protein